MNEFIELPVNKNSLAKRKPIFGVGINDADYQIHPNINGKQYNCPYYQIWVGILSRCYSTKKQSKAITYLGCTVDPRWYLFSNFKSWMMSQDWRDKHLDKDLLIRGNKIYSPEACIFVTQEINNIISNNAINRGDWLIGVNFDKASKKFRASCSAQNKKKHLGCFDTELEAHNAYKAFKKQVLIDAAYKQQDLRLQQALLRISEEY